MLLLLLLLLLLTSAQAQEQETDEEKDADNDREAAAARGNTILYLAESLDTNTALSTRTIAMGRPQVFHNQLWQFDAAQQVPTAVIGTARGVCWLVDDENKAWDCQWTLTISANEAEDAAHGDEDETTTASSTAGKIILQSDATTLTGANRMAIVGGTGAHAKTRGSVEVTQAEMFRVYALHLV